MRIFIEVEVRIMPFCATKRNKRGVIVHREKLEGGSDLYRNKNYEIYDDMRRRFGTNAMIAITYFLRNEDEIV